MSTIEAARQALDEFASLPPDWDSYGAKPITPEAIEAVRRYLGKLCAHGPVSYPVHLAPLSSGGIMVELFTGSVSEASIDFGPDGELINDG